MKNASITSKKVFLGGTCNGSDWRETLIPQLKIEYFNPVVATWTPECQAEELRQRQDCDFCLYVITPKMTGVYSIAEVVDDSNKRPQKTIFCVLQKDGEMVFDAHQTKSLQAVAEMVESNGGKVFTSLQAVAHHLNTAQNDDTMDYYLQPEHSSQRLLEEYRHYQSLVVAFDFDDTVYDFHQKGRQYSEVIQLLRDLKKIGCHLICWTGQQDLHFVASYLNTNAIPFDIINENPPFHQSDSRKIYANAYLDDRAGLRQVFEELRIVVRYANNALAALNPLN